MYLVSRTQPKQRKPTLLFQVRKRKEVGGEMSFWGHWNKWDTATRKTYISKCTSEARKSNSYSKFAQVVARGPFETHTTSHRSLLGSGPKESGCLLDVIVFLSACPQKDCDIIRVRNCACNNFKETEDDELRSRIHDRPGRLWSSAIAFLRELLRPSRCALPAWATAWYSSSGVRDPPRSLSKKLKLFCMLTRNSCSLLNSVKSIVPLPFWSCTLNRNEQRNIVKSRRKGAANHQAHASQQNNHSRMQHLSTPRPMHERKPLTPQLARDEHNTSSQRALLG